MIYESIGESWNVSTSNYKFVLHQSPWLLFHSQSLYPSLDIHPLYHTIPWLYHLDLSFFLGNSTLASTLFISHTTLFPFLSHCSLNRIYNSMWLLPRCTNYHGKFAFTSLKPSRPTNCPPFSLGLCPLTIVDIAIYFISI